MPFREIRATWLRQVGVSVCNLSFGPVILALLLLPGCSPARVQEGIHLD